MIPKIVYFVSKYRQPMVLLCVVLALGGWLAFKGVPNGSPVGPDIEAQWKQKIEKADPERREVADIKISNCRTDVPGSEYVCNVTYQAKARDTWISEAATYKFKLNFMNWTTWRYSGASELVVKKEGNQTWRLFLYALLSVGLAVVVWRSRRLPTIDWKNRALDKRADLPHVGPGMRTGTIADGVGDVSAGMVNASSKLTPGALLVLVGLFLGWIGFQLGTLALPSRFINFSDVTGFDSIMLWVVAISWTVLGMRLLAPLLKVLKYWLAAVVVFYVVFVPWGYLTGGPSATERLNSWTSFSMPTSIRMAGPEPHEIRERQQQIWDALLFSRD